MPPKQNSAPRTKPLFREEKIEQCLADLLQPIHQLEQPPLFEEPSNDSDHTQIISLKLELLEIIQSLKKTPLIGTLCLQLYRSTVPVDHIPYTAYQTVISRLILQKLPNPISSQTSSEDAVSTKIEQLAQQFLKIFKTNSNSSREISLQALLFTHIYSLYTTWQSRLQFATELTSFAHFYRQLTFLIQWHYLMPHIGSHNWNDKAIREIIHNLAMDYLERSPISDSLTNTFAILKSKVVKYATESSIKKEKFDAIHTVLHTYALLAPSPSLESLTIFITHFPLYVVVAMEKRPPELVSLMTAHMFCAIGSTIKGRLIFH
jgi:hypothetical protein